MDEHVVQLVEINRRALMRFLEIKLGNVHDAEDIIQDVSTRLYRVPDLDKVGNPRAFLFRIASNLAIDELRRRERQHWSRSIEIAAIHDTVATGDPNPEEALITKTSAAALEVAIDALPEKTKRVFVMSRFDGKSHGDISRELGVSQKTVEYHITQALVRLRDCIMT